jgi:hypothetical protein
MTGDVPKIAPFNSCVSCFRGDTSTFVQIRGKAEWHVAALMRFAELGQAEATGTFLHWAEEQGGRPGMVPEGEIEAAFRLCRDCARRTGADVVEPGDEMGTVYVQP